MLKILGKLMSKKTEPDKPERKVKVIGLTSLIKSENLVDVTDSQTQKGTTEYLLKKPVELKFEIEGTFYEITVRSLLEKNLKKNEATKKH